MRWTDDDAKQLVAIFNDSNTVKEAYQKLRRIFPDKSQNAIRFFISSRFKKSPTQLLADSKGMSVAESNTRSENLKLKKEVESLRNELQKTRLAAFTSEHLQELIHEIHEIDFETPPSWTLKRRSASLHGCPFLLISDVHYDEVVIRSQLGGVNEYSHQIAEKRIIHTFDTAIDILQNLFARPSYDGIVIPLNGDIFSGNIHEELRETNAQPIFKSIADLVDLMAAQLVKCADVFGHVFVPCAVGNHGRIDKKPRAKNRVFDNYEWLFYHFLAKQFKDDDRVNFLIPESFEFIYQIYNKRILQLHGDVFKGGNGIGGILVPIMRGLAKKQQAYAAIKKPFDLAIIGHFHSYHTLPDLVINGSVKGYDEFSKLMGFKFEAPMQALWVEHPERGSIFHTPIICNSYGADK